MDRGDFVLAALSSVGQYASFTPAQVQKLFFLIDREAGPIAGGPYFNFKPYDYGPFDSDVYGELNGLAKGGQVTIEQGQYFREYRATPEGIVQGTALLAELDERAQKYIKEAASWVRSVNFRTLVSSIYSKYPDMRVKSIFRQ